MKRYILTSVLAAVAFVLAGAQKTITFVGEKAGGNRLIVDDYKVERTQRKTIVTMNFVLDSMRVGSNRYRAFTPVIRSKDGQHTQRLKTFIATGRTQNIVFERDGIDPLYADNCETLRRYNGSPQTYAYTETVDLQPWHKGADVLVECDLCGCGDTLRSQRELLGTLMPPDPLYNIVDMVPGTYKAPRSLHGTAYITFVVDRWEMKPDYMDNRRELRKITDTLDIMVADKHIHVDRIQIHGWASPESPYEHNRMLATNRAKSLTDYVRQQYSLPASVFAKAEATPENWIGLQKAVEKLSEDVLPNKAAILNIIKDTSLEPDPKEWRIKQRYPDDYRYLLKNVYPSLRRSDYEIRFRIDEFTTAEAAEIIKTKPQQLSLYEMWNVAHTFEPYSDDYNRVMQIAVNVYPDSTAAIINLANVALRQKDTLKAETLLMRAGNSAEAENARAVLYMQKERWDEAEAALARAEKLGMDVSVNRNTIKEQR